MNQHAEDRLEQLTLAALRHLSPEDQLAVALAANEKARREAPPHVYRGGRNSRKGRRERALRQLERARSLFIILGYQDIAAAIDAIIETVGQKPAEPEERVI